jgi:RNA polymerase sigma factor (sigma-70 family)
VDEPMWGPSDEALLAGLASRDEEATAAFVQRFQRRVYGLAFLILGDADAASDVVQETFLRVWRHAEAFDPRRGAVGPWVLSIARNLAVDHLRLRRWSPVEPASLRLVEGPSGEPGPEERAIADADAERLRRALGQLPQEQRRAVVLAAFYGRTAREIADLEGVPLGTVKTRVRSALLKLRAALEVER